MFLGNKPCHRECGETFLTQAEEWHCCYGNLFTLQSLDHGTNSTIVIYNQIEQGMHGEAKISKEKMKSIFPSGNNPEEI